MSLFGILGFPFFLHFLTYSLNSFFDHGKINATETYWMEKVRLRSQGQQPETRLQIAGPDT